MARNKYITIIDKQFKYEPGSVSVIITTDKGRRLQIVVDKLLIYVTDLNDLTVPHKEYCTEGFNQYMNTQYAEIIFDCIWRLLPY